MEQFVGMKDHGFRGHLLQRHKTVELERARKRTIIGLYLSRELEQARSERTVIGVYMSGLIEMRLLVGCDRSGHGLWLNAVTWMNDDVAKCMPS
jgi:hypothetical protein